MNTPNTIRTTGEPVIDPAAAGLKLDDVQLGEVCRQLTLGPLSVCPACNGGEFRRIAVRDRYGFPLDYVACEGCGLVFANPYYDTRSLDGFYINHYSRVYGRTAHAEDMFRAEKARGRRVAGLLKTFARSQGVKLASCLDLGCSHGGFLASLPSDWLRVGYDYDPSLFECGRRLGLELRSIEELPSERRTFDVVMANQVLEHSQDALDFLSKMRGFLAPGGVIYVEVPGMRSPLSFHIDVRLMFKNAHHYLFDAGTLTRCAARVGLKPASVNEIVEALLVVDDAASTAVSPAVGAGAASVQFLAQRVRDQAAGMSLARRLRWLAYRVAEISRRLLERMRSIG